jgi:hypothetical protein
MCPDIWKRDYYRRSIELYADRGWRSKTHPSKCIRCALVLHLEMAGQTGAALGSVSVEIEIDTRQRFSQDSREKFLNSAQGLEQYLRCQGGRERWYSSAEDLTGAVGPERRQRDITFSQRNGTWIRLAHSSVNKAGYLVWTGKSYLSRRFFHCL